MISCDIIAYHCHRGLARALRAAREGVGGEPGDEEEMDECMKTNSGNCNPAVF